MTATMNQAAIDAPVVPRSKGKIIVDWITSTDHKTIGYMYLIASFLFFCVGGVMALIIRLELFDPGMQIIETKEQYNQLFTMHGTLMLLMFATPLFSGFANVIMPLQIGAPDVAFPRLNAFAFWMYLFGSLIAVSGFLTPQGAASFGWTAYAPLSNTTFTPGAGGNLWVLGLALQGIGTILGSVNFITTIITMRAPGMTMFRMPIFTWNTLITGILVLMAFQPLAAALLVLGADRVLGSHVFSPGNGGPILWQHLFWFFGHPEVYVIALPFFGIVTEIFPVFSRKPVFGYKELVFATISIAALSVTVWAHHMYVTGVVALPFFAFMTMLIAIPTGVKFFNWVGTMWRGSITFETPMVWSIGFLVTFLFGGLTGVILASPALDQQVSDSYFVVAHFHYVIFGTVVFAMFAGFYFWWPKWTGKMLNEKLGHIHFWMLFIGFHATFLVQHWLGVDGMPRRYADYLPQDGFTWMNQVSTVGAMVLGLSMVPFFWNVWITSRNAPKVTVDDPWGYGGSLEWATSCPPPRHNFTSLPRIRSERPAFDVNHPELLEYAGHGAPETQLAGGGVK
ncbi:aa3-type cytochrome oxidase subunit I [Brevibacterium aurantiacum]|uniref:Cytochrome c oxidase subunit 1 n=2 Tax=Brevibacterium aurantiacum TaxID=273384 RepID=A0A2H1HUK7_BREAU|nr:cytochrome c oxidase subunit I [Brevibacterium aurantiacum]AZL09421.1 cytochrome c oxidase subunit I [Brevibacterium aurantiacum]PCC47285.1 cytochrome c oxidase subunit I [Brevibacterium aurantiacum]TGD36879.1 cytochrome c oxidase subunit I [Brevibacterium aurantiacum]SMX66592.1 cytochrome c oxidase subunit 1 [Brevibacterium aurantiacum]SMX71514.1 cytochrome c oxidase subunit 1 [Brevibacterium aurantiacum]